MKLGQLVGKIPVKKVHKKSDLLIDSETLLGVEVEAENCVKLYDELQKEAFYWTHKEDHSLRNNGREFVFSEPLFGADAVRAIEFICKQAVDLNWKISNLCGLHVHADMREMELEELRNFCVTYSLVEPLIYNWVGDNRSENLFCVPWNIAENDLNPISAIVKQQINGPVVEYIKGLHKYSGLNLQALANFGTAEFRMLKTTFDPKKILKWINIILALKKYSKTQGLRADDIVYRIRVKGPAMFIRDVFGESLALELWYDTYPKDVVLIVGPIAEWFLDSARDLFIKSKGQASAFDWIRQQKLSGDDKHLIGDHIGLKKWNERKLAPKPPKAQVVVEEEKKVNKKTPNKDWLLAELSQAEAKAQVQWYYNHVDANFIKIDPEENI